MIVIDPCAAPFATNQLPLNSFRLPSTAGGREDPASPLPGRKLLDCLGACCHCNKIIRLSPRMVDWHIPRRDPTNQSSEAASGPALGNLSNSKKKAPYQAVMPEAGSLHSAGGPQLCGALLRSYSCISPMSPRSRALVMAATALPNSSGYSCESRRASRLPVNVNRRRQFLSHLVGCPHLSTRLDATIHRSVRAITFPIEFLTQSPRQCFPTSRGKF